MQYAFRSIRAHDDFRLHGISLVGNEEVHRWNGRKRASIDSDETAIDESGGEGVRGRDVLVGGGVAAPEPHHAKA